MQDVQAWCYTVCAGVIFCGIVMILVPSGQYQKIMQMVLGLFILLCILSWGKLSAIQLEWNTDEAEQRRQEVADDTTDYFLNRVKEQSEESIRVAVQDYLAQYGINQREYEIYIETGESTDNSAELSVVLRLPERLRQYQSVIYQALSYELGITVRMEYQS